MAREVIKHESLDRPENIWRDGRTSDFMQWWIHTFFRRLYERNETSSVALFKRILGRQDTTVVLRHRNWIWHRPDEGWTLYVDRRGPALHVAQNATPDEAWAAFERFKARIEEYLAS